MSDLLHEKSDHIARITLNRPDRMNAITFEMIMELGKAVADADDDDEIRVVIVTGAGRGFCSGGR